MVYTKYFTIYDDTVSSRQSRSRDTTHEHQHYPNNNVTTPTAQTSLYHRSSSSDQAAIAAAAAAYHSTSSSSKSPPSRLSQPSQNQQPEPQSTRYTSHLNLHTGNHGHHYYYLNGSDVAGAAGGGISDARDSSRLVRRSSSNSSNGLRSNISRKLDYFDSKYGSGSNNASRAMFRLRAAPEPPILEEVTTTYPIYAVDNNDDNLYAETAAASRRAATTTTSSDVAYRYYDVEIPIQKTNRIHFDANSLRSQLKSPPHTSQPTLKLDVEINNNTKLSKKCKNYEVRDCYL